MSATARQTLVLNADYRPLCVYPLSLRPAQKGVGAVVRGKAEAIENWPDLIRSPTIEMFVPKTIVLKKFAHIYATPKFCRRSVLLRDHSSCQYCGETFPASELTFDHVIPRSAGGQTVWDNILMACVACNARKRAQPADWSGRKGKGLRPLKQPRQPTSMELMKAGMSLIDPVIIETWHDWLYWSAELRA